MDYNILIGIGLGALLLYLFRSKTVNVNDDKKLSENQALVEQSIKDLEAGIANIKPEQRPSDQVEDYYNKDKK